MRVNVVIAPFYLADEFDRLLPTTAVGCIQADLRRCGHEVRIHDLRPLVATRNRWREYLNSVRSWVMEVPQLRLIDRLRHKFAAGRSEAEIVEIDEADRAEILALAMDLCTSPFDYLATFKLVHEMVAKSVDDLVGGDAVVLTTAIYTNIYANFLLALLLKRRRPDLPIIIGGPSVYQSPRFARYLAATGAFDGVAMGDAEVILEPFLDAIATGRDLGRVPGVLTRRSPADAAPAPAVDLRALPPPDYSGFDPKRYLPFTLPVHATRGCPYRCRYCSEHRESFAYMPVPQFVRDITTLKARHRTRFFFFCDSLMNGDREWFWDLCDELAPLDVRWIAYLRLGDKQPLTDAQVARLVRAGAFMVRLGVDSLEPTILRDMARPQNVGGIIHEMAMLREAGIQVDANIITGFPGETRETVVEAIRQLSVVTTESDRRFADGPLRLFDRLAASDFAEMPVEDLAAVQVNIYPFQVRPGSRMYDRPEQDGITYECFDPDSFGYEVPAEIADLVRVIPDSFVGPVLADEILQRVRVVNRALHQPGDAIARVRAMAITLWLRARCVEPQDVVGPLGPLPLYAQDAGGEVLYLQQAGQHVPVRGTLASVIRRLKSGDRVSVEELLTLGPEPAVRHALALLIVAGWLPIAQVDAPAAPAPSSERRAPGSAREAPAEHRIYLPLRHADT